MAVVVKIKTNKAGSAAPCNELLTVSPVNPTDPKRHSLTPEIADASLIILELI